MGYVIAHVGAFDFENFGDLLFMDVVEHHLKKRIQISKIIHFAPKGNVKVGDRKIFSVKDLEKIHLKENFNAIIVGGGDLIHLQKILITDSKTENWDIYDVLYMWMISTMVAKCYNLPVLWNAPGVPLTIPDVHKKVFRILCNNIDYLSVRDEDSKYKLLEAGIKDVKVIPDTVLTINEIFDKNELFDEYLKDYYKKSNYIIFQANTKLNDDELRECAEVLLKIKKEYKLNILLLPIGPSMGDVKVLKKIQEMQPACFELYDKEFDRMHILALIANARMYIGSSLHGCIVANSYQVPAIVCNYNRYNKIDGFVKLIDFEESEIFFVHDIYRKFEELIDKDVSNYCYQKRLINEHFDEITEIISINHKKMKNEFVLISEYLYDISEQYRKLESTETTLKHQENTIEIQNNKIIHLENENNQLREMLDGILNSSSWKITKPMRKISSLIKK